MLNSKTYLHYMLLLNLIIIPLIGIFIIMSGLTFKSYSIRLLKSTAFFITILNLINSLIVWLLFDNSEKHFQFVQEHYIIGNYDFYLGIDGLSVYFVLLTTIIMPISILSN